MMQIGAALHDAITANVPLLQSHCRDPWVVIGSAACALAGGNVEVADLDLLTSTADAQRLIDLWSAQLDASYIPAGADHFRSRFARFQFPGMPLEVMGDLQWRDADGWHAVRVNHIVHVSIEDIAVPIPSRTEQIRILESFGRPKDLARAELLRALSACANRSS
jgi:hypothetical protein